MWFTFFEAVIFGALFLFIPGYLILKAMRFSHLTSLSCAPIVTIFGILVLGIAYAEIGVRSNWISIGIPLLLTGFLGCIIPFAIKKTDRKKPKRSIRSQLTYRDVFCSDIGCLAFYILVACVLSLVFFVIPLDGPDSFGQDVDNTWHIPLIHSFAESGNISILDTTLYHDHINDNFNLTKTEGGFYPAIWHGIAALIYSFIGVSEPLCGNATNLLLLCLVFPSGMFVLLHDIFSSNRHALWCGAIITMSFGAFPWHPLLPITGPLYPFFTGMALLPILLFSFIKTTELNMPKKDRAKYASLFLISSIAIAGSHTSVIFTAAVFLFPYCIYIIYTRLLHSKIGFTGKRAPVLAVCAICCILFGIIWLLLFNAPPLYATTHFMWPASTDKIQAFIDILFVAYRRPFSQIMLGLFIVIGIIYSIRDKRYLWLSCAYIFACCICFACVSTESFIKSILAGFWYTDPYRVAATAAFIGIPLASLGFCNTIRFLVRVIRSATNPDNYRAYKRISTATVVLCFFIFNFYPNYVIPGKYEVSSAFGDILYYMIDGNDAARPNTFAPEEKEFVEKVADIVEPDAVIYNNADDGSPFGYSQNDLNLAYRRSSVMMILDNESEDSRMLRKQINEIGYNEQVKEAASNNNIEYILVLDMGGEILGERCFHGYYDPETWSGINAITDETPGLEVVLSEGDMRLYRITDSD